MSKRDLQASVALALAIGVATAAAAPALAQGLPQHMVAYMSGAGQKECPDNWTEAAYAQGRLILGTTDGSKIQKVAGTPAKPNQVPQHDHAFKITATVGSEERRLNPFDGHYIRVEGGQVTSTGTTDATPTALPFIQYLVCEHTAAESPDSAPYGTVAFFNARSCPGNWEPLAQADGRFFLPAFPDSTGTYATKTTWDPDGPAGHTHGLSASFETYPMQFLHYSGQHADFAKPGWYVLSGTSATAGPVLPFVSLLVCEKSTGVGHSEGIPLHTVAFFGSSECPDDWGNAIGAPGRFIIGVGGEREVSQGLVLGGDPIQSPVTSIQHDHAFSGDAEFPAGYDSKRKWSGGTDANNYVAGTVPYSATSGSATDELPYLVLQACSYTAGQDWQGAEQPGRQ